MAASLVSREVSDLCIGKPPLRPLPLSATVAEVVVALRRSGEACIVVWEDLEHEPDGKVSMADVIGYLCSGKNITSPAAALASPVSSLLHDKPAGLVRRVEPHCSVLEAIDIMLDGAQNLVVPIRSPATPGGGALPEFCWLTQEDFIRFFLNSISHFSHAPALSVAALGIIHTDVLSVHGRDSALSALPLLELAAAEQTAVAVVTNDHRLVGEISPAAIAGCDEAAAAALAALSAGELADYLRRGGGERAEVAVRARLREKRMEGMLELLEEGLVPAVSSSSSVSSLSQSPSTSSDESESDEEGAAAARRWRRGSRAAGRRSEEMAVCQAGSSLVAVMMQALAHRVSHVWVVDGGDYGLAGVVAFPEMLGVFRDLLM